MLRRDRPSGRIAPRFARRLATRFAREMNNINSAAKINFPFK